MTLHEIRQMPTSHDNVHESIYRSYHALAKIMQLMRAGAPPSVLDEIYVDLCPDRGGVIELAEEARKG